MAKPSFGAMLLAMRDELVKVIPDKRHIYLISQQMPLPNMTGDRDILIRPRGFVADQNTAQAAGNEFTRMRRLVDVILRTRSSLDAAHQHGEWLTKQAKGHLDFEDEVLNCLQLWNDVRDETTDTSIFVPMNAEPIRLVQSSDPAKDAQSADGKWGLSILTFEFVYGQPFENVR